MKCGIYQIRNTQTDKRYIGSAINVTARWAVHRRDLDRGRHHSVKLQRAWQKYGESAFTFDVLLICAPEHLLMYEQCSMEAFNAFHEGYNCAPRAGSPNVGRWISEVTRAKMRAARAGGRPSLGMKHSLKARAAISVAQRRRARTHEQAARLATLRLGATLTDETKAKISAAMAGKKRAPRPPDVREKIRAALLQHFNNLSSLRRDNNNG